MTTIRKRVPEPVQDLGRDGYVRLGAATAGLRMQPSFILIGAQRCGTTSLFRALMEHPQVVRPAFHKGVNYFDLNYYRGERWYRGHFPLAGPARLRTARHGGPVSFEASGYYLYHPFAFERLARDLPGVKLVALLRNPVDRAFSAYKHEYVRGFETESFERALDLEDERLSGEIEKMRADPSYESLPHRHHSYRHRGHYAEQLERLFKLFPQRQVHIIGSEAFFSESAEQYRVLLAFLGLQPFQPATFGQYNGHRSEPMPPQIRRSLEDYYAPHNQRLASLLGRPVPWLR